MSLAHFQITCMCICAYIYMEVFVCTFKSKPPVTYRFRYVFMCVQEYNVMLKNRLKVLRCQQLIHWKLMAQFLWICQETFARINLLILFLVSKLQIFPCHSHVILFLAEFLVLLWGYFSVYFSAVLLICWRRWFYLKF